MRLPLLHLYFSLTLLVSTFASYDSNALSLQCMRRIFVNQYEKAVPIGVNVGVIDVGSSTVKLYLKNGVTGEVLSENYLIDLGKSLGKSGTVDAQAYESLKAALAKARTTMENHQFSVAHLDAVATAGIRDAKNGKEIIALLKKEGFPPIRILSESEESSLVYRSVMKNQQPPWQPGAVIEVGGGSTEIAFADNFYEMNLEKTKVIHAGSGSLAIKDPFDSAEIQKAAKKTRDLLNQASHPATEPALQDVFIGQGRPMRLLKELHASMTGKDIFENGISREFLDWYLSPKGLAKLKDFANDPLNAAEANGISQIPSKLLVLREVMDHYRFPRIRFGSAGGMKEAIASELETRVVGKQIDKVTTQMGKQWAKAETNFSDKMTELVDPQDFGKWEFRVKATPSVENKLTTKWIKGSASMDKLQKASNAHEFIGDGIGGRLTLENAGPQKVNEFYSRMLHAVREKEVKITEIHNYRAPGGSAYFTDAQVKSLAEEIEKTTGKRPMVKTGAEGEKPSGYTGLHLNMMDSKGLQYEVQVRGKMVSELAEFEHRFYDIRQGKGLAHADEKLIHALARLTPEQEPALLNYIRDYYVYARKLEQHLPGIAPALPLELKQYPVLSLDAALRPFLTK